MIKFLSFSNFFHSECIPLCIPCILNAFHCAFLAFCFQVSKTQLFLLRLFVEFVDFKFKFCWEFLSWMFFNHREWITSCFDALNQSHSILSCIFSGFFYRSQTGTSMVSQTARLGLSCSLCSFRFLLVYIITVYKVLHSYKESHTKGKYYWLITIWATALFIVYQGRWPGQIGL